MEALHASVTVEPLTLAVRPLGGPGAFGPPETPLTVTMTSFDGGLVPTSLAARTLKKYTPFDTLFTVDDVAAFPVENTVKSVPPGADPASTM
jgi:hypothetical protein